MQDNHAQVREVGLRDGLQMVQTILSTPQKLEWCRRMVAAGCTEIEVTSFVPPRIVPQFADSDDVARGDMLSAIHRLLGGERERACTRIHNLGFDRIRHSFIP